VKLPHYLIHAPRIAALFGHDGVTVMCWTFVRRREVSEQFRRHEYRHVVQWVVLTLLGFAQMAVLALLGWASWWQLPMGVLLFPICYFLSFIPNGYHGSWFERDADRYAARIHDT